VLAKKHVYSVVKAVAPKVTKVKPSCLKITVEDHKKQIQTPPLRTRYATEGCGQLSNADRAMEEVEQGGEGQKREGRLCLASQGECENSMTDFTNCCLCKIDEMWFPVNSVVHS
jgi:hypothetical protein